MIAVIQVEALKNPCRLWMWNSLVADPAAEQRPGDADQAGEDKAL